MSDDRAARVRRVHVGRPKLALPEDVVAQGMSVFEEVLMREAALRILFPVEAENPSRSRAQRRWLVNFDLEEVIAGARAGHCERPVESHMGLKPMGDPQVIGVSCALATPTAEQRAKYPDTVEYHQAHETLGECDAWRCRCGNEAHIDGFYPCDAEGNEREVPDDSDLVFCGSCGVLISVETGEYAAQRAPWARDLA